MSGIGAGPPIQELADQGFALQAVLDVAALPPWVSTPMRAAGIGTSRYTRLVMLGQAGSTLWDTMEHAGYEADDRFDEFSKRCVSGWIADAHPGAEHEVIYPGDALVPLGRMAELVGWGLPSPLGLTVHAEYGPWIAHRIVFLTDIDLALTAIDRLPHPCDTCVDKPCITSCPAGAVNANDPFDIGACASERVSEPTSCATQCLARNACPIGTQHRYGESQMRHHYGSGLDSIRLYAAKSNQPR
jgi:epoxyqueuosine reductase